MSLEKRSHEEDAITVAGAADIDAIVALVNGAYRGDSSRRGWTTEADLLGGQRADADGIAALIEERGNAVLTPGFVPACTCSSNRTNRATSAC
jgi:hypothetical protein